MKEVSFEVAKTIKELGYPQCGDLWYSEFGVLSDDWSSEIKYCVAPTYIEVWLWLWRDKYTFLCPRVIQKDDSVGEYTWIISSWDTGYIDKSSVYSFFNNDERNPFAIMDDVDDPEDAIIAAIDYIINNNLIK